MGLLMVKISGLHVTRIPSYGLSRSKNYLDVWKDPFC